MKYSLCHFWEFTEVWTEDFALGEGNFEKVCLPHNVKELPLHYADSDSYQMVCGYRMVLHPEEKQRGKRLFLQFDGAAHIATVFVNGRELATHRCGYTAFRVDISDVLTYGADNWLAVRLDTSENPEVPPFGFVIDYLTYGGLYREVWLDIREESYIEDIFVHTPTVTSAVVQVTAKNAANCFCRVEIFNSDGKLVQLRTVSASGAPLTIDHPTARRWSPERPSLYICRVKLLDDAGTMLDTQEVVFGFRTAVFKADGFYLNGKKTFLRGLNRHQSYPYIGYAAPERLQREDARILKQELGCNAVRTSHYPQSQHFLDECDRLGLLVFTEIPGWQHIGDAHWQDQAVENTREMVLQNRNHPSIILWGVRINESQDNDTFYRRTNEVAHRLDPSRATSGVRYMEKSSLLEDVYGYNDFSHTGNNPGVKPKKSVTPNTNKALLITEHNGHMFPTKSFDTWQRRQDHALRHTRVQDDAASDGGHAGCFGWCMFDYPTHKDFGSGDRVCYHGVMDAFRNPKTAAWLYASQQESHPVLEVASPMDIGDYPAGSIGDVAVFTNAEEVRLYKNDIFVTTLSNGPWKGLPHGPMVLDDTIGELLQTQEGFPEKKANELKKALLSAGKYGLAAMPVADKLRMVKCMLQYGMKLEDGVVLYGKYVGNWGGEATRWRFDAVKGGKVVASVTKRPNCALRLSVTVGSPVLHRGATYDMTSLRIRILDEYGNVASYAQLPVSFRLEGAAQLVGPETVTAEGGMCGTYVRTGYTPGSASLTITAPGLTPVTVDFVVE